MPQAMITPDLDTVVCEIDIAAPLQRVFQALTDGAAIDTLVHRCRLSREVLEV
jgi:uncharacterized protein YndB with AHSA1/START domain